MDRFVAFDYYSFNIEFALKRLKGDRKVLSFALFYFSHVVLLQMTLSSIRDSQGPNTSSMSLSSGEPGSSLGWSSLDLVWTLAFSLIVATSLLGNCLVIWIVTGLFTIINIFVNPVWHIIDSFNCL